MWVTLTVATPLLLLSGYLAAWLLFTSWASSRGVFPPGSYTMCPVPSSGRTIVFHPAFESIHRYIAAGWPGADLLAALGSEVFERSLSPGLPPPPPKPDGPVIEEIDHQVMDGPQ